MSYADGLGAGRDSEEEADGTAGSVKRHKAEPQHGSLLDILPAACVDLVMQHLQGKHGVMHALFATSHATRNIVLASAPRVQLVPTASLSAQRMHALAQLLEPGPGNTTLPCLSLNLWAHELPLLAQVSALQQGRVKRLELRVGVAGELHAMVLSTCACM